MQQAQSRLSEQPEQIGQRARAAQTGGSPRPRQGRRRVFCLKEITEQQPPPRPEHAGHFSQRGFAVRQERQHALAEQTVKNAAAQGQGERRAAQKRQTRRGCVRLSVATDGTIAERAQKTQRRPRATADVQQTRACRKGAQGKSAPGDGQTAGTPGIPGDLPEPRLRVKG